jgi:hypothetical protein
MVTWLIVIVGILVVGIIACIYAIRNLLRKYETAESMNNDKDIWIQNFKEVIDLLNTRLQQIDHRGSFESDDEVGIFFSELKKIQQILNEQFIDEND